MISLTTHGQMQRNPLGKVFYTVLWVGQVAHNDYGHKLAEQQTARLALAAEVFSARQRVMILIRKVTLCKPGSGV